MSSDQESKRATEPTLHEIGALLEEVRDQVSAVAEGVEDNGARLDRVETELKHINERFDRLEAEVVAIRTVLGTPEQPNIITREEYAKLDQRLRKVEEHLKLAA